MGEVTEAQLCGCKRACVIVYGIYRDRWSTCGAIMAENGTKDETAKVCVYAGGRTSQLCLHELVWACLSTELCTWCAGVTFAG